MRGEDVRESVEDVRKGCEGDGVRGKDVRASIK